MNDFNTKKEWRFDGLFLDYLANFPDNAIMASAVSEYSRNGKTKKLLEIEKQLDVKSEHLYWYLCREIDLKKVAYYEGIKRKQSKTKKAE